MLNLVSFKYEKVNDSYSFLSFLRHFFEHLPLPNGVLELEEDLSRGLIKLGLPSCGILEKNYLTYIVSQAIWVQKTPGWDTRAQLNNMVANKEQLHLWHFRSESNQCRCNFANKPWINEITQIYSQTSWIKRK